MLILLTIGFVSPLLIGAWTEDLARPILRVRGPAIAPTGEAYDQHGKRDDREPPASPGEADGFTYPYTPSETPFLLDYTRSLARARASHKPVLLLFTVVLNSDARAFEVAVLRSPAVVARLRKFECAAAVLDIVPLPDKSDAARLCSQNEKLRKIFFEGQGMRWRPTIAVVRPEFDGTSDSASRQLLAKAESWELTDDPAIVSRFLDDALKEWSKSQN